MTIAIQNAQESAHFPNFSSDFTGFSLDQLMELAG